MRHRRYISASGLQDVVEGIRATGRGYNARRVEKVLRDALARGDV